MATSLLEYHKNETAGNPLLAAMLFTLDSLLNNYIETAGSECVNYHDGGYVLDVDKDLLEGENGPSPFKCHVVVDVCVPEKCTPNTGAFLKNRLEIEEHWNNLKYTIFPDNNLPVLLGYMDYFKTILQHASLNPGDHTIQYQHAFFPVVENTASIKACMHSYVFTLFNLVTVAFHIIDFSEMDLLGLKSLNRPKINVDQNSPYYNYIQNVFLKNMAKVPTSQRNNCEVD